MNDFENELIRALKHVEPPPGFTERVLERLSREGGSVSQHGKHAYHQRQWLAAAAALVLLAGSGMLYQHREEHLKGEAAKNKLLIALRLAGSKLQQAQEQVQTVGSPEIN